MSSPSRVGRAQTKDYQEMHTDIARTVRWRTVYAGVL
jgi:hypothetical protein